MRGMMAYAFPCSKGFTEDMRQLYNDFVLVTFALPVTEGSPQARLKACQSEFFKLKYSIAPIFMRVLGKFLLRMGLMSVTYETFTKAVSNMTMIYSNVRGPSDRLKFAGRV